MIRHLLRMRYRVVYDSVVRLYKVEYRKWWSHRWVNTEDIMGWYRSGLSSKQDAIDLIGELQARNHANRFSVVYKC